jgi:hypothetical protein
MSWSMGKCSPCTARNWTCSPGRSMLLRDRCSANARDIRMNHV